jgi:hypothetical protein
MLTNQYKNIKFCHVLFAHKTFQFAPQFDRIIITELCFMLDLEHFNLSLISSRVWKVILI